MTQLWFFELSRARTFAAIYVWLLHFLCPDRYVSLFLSRLSSPPLKFCHRVNKWVWQSGTIDRRARATERHAAVKWSWLPWWRCSMPKIFTFVSFLQLFFGWMLSSWGSVPVLSWSCVDKNKCSFHREKHHRFQKYKCYYIVLHFYLFSSFYHVYSGLLYFLVTCPCKWVCVYVCLCVWGYSEWLIHNQAICVLIFVLKKIRWICWGFFFSIDWPF